MNFPMQYPIFQFFYWLLNTAGLGGIVWMLLLAGAALLYGFIINWVRTGSQADEDEVYAYPTPGLHQHEAHKD